MTKHLLAVSDFTLREIEQLLVDAAALKAEAKRGAGRYPLQGKTLGLFFEKRSTRTRISFEAAIHQLGGASLFLSAQDLQIGRGEPIRDTARVLSRYLSGLVIRTFGHDRLTEWADQSTIPIINGLTDKHHPCQALADLFTITERFGSAKGLRLAFIGDGNNVAHSLLETGAMSGMNVIVACPKGYEPDPGILRAAQRAAEATGAKIAVVTKPEEAARDADVLYSDVWTSMGQEKEAAKRKKAFKGYQINSKLVRLAKPSAVVMHCLPAYRGYEITEEVMESPRSIIFDQAENRLHLQKALLERLLR